MKVRRALAIALVGALGLGTGLAGQAAGADVRYYSLGTASTAGTWYILGAGLASHMNKQLSDIKVTAEVTAGSIENYYLLKRGKMDLVMSKPDMISDDLLERKYGGDPKGKIAQLLWSYQMSEYQWFVKESSPIRTLRDLKGKRVAVGPQGASSLIINLRIIKAATGYEPDRDFKALYYNFAEGQRALQDNVVDLAMNAGGAPVASVLELASRVDLRFLSLTDEDIARFQQQYPGKATRTVIPKGTYKGQTEDIVTLGEPTGILVSPAMPEEAAYKLMKAMFSNVAQRNTFHVQAEKFNLDATVGIGAEIAKLGIPFHPGAVRYLKETGRWSPKLEVR